MLVLDDWIHDAAGARHPCPPPPAIPFVRFVPLAMDGRAHRRSGATIVLVGATLAAVVDRLTAAG
jgi:hypothetical protein